MSEGSCVSCLSTHHNFVLSNDLVRLVRCLNCGLVYQDGWLDDFQPDLYDYYSKRIGLPREAVYNELNCTQQTALLEKMGTRKGRLLDVGCGNGELVYNANRLGWDGLGIDLSSSAVKLAKSLGSTCEMINFFSNELEASSYQLIMMSELIEHVGQPVNFMKRAEELLVEGGYLYVSTPNFRSLTRHLVGSRWGVIHPEHLSYFCCESLKRMIRHTNLKIVESSSWNIDLGQIKSTWLTFGKHLETLDTAVLRQKIADSKKLGMLKRLVNECLNQFNLGDNLVMLCQKTREA